MSSFFNKSPKARGNVRKCSENRRKWLRMAYFGGGPRNDFLSILAGLVDAGVDLNKALTEMHRVFAQEGDAKADIIADILSRLQDGDAMHRAFAPWLEPHESILLASASQGVDLGTAMRNAADLTASRGRIVSAILSPLAYPAVLLLIGAVVLLVFSYQVIPALSTIIPADKWKGLGLLYVQASGAIRHYGIHMLWAIIIMISVMTLSLGRWKPTGAMRKWVDKHLPPWNLYQLYHGAILLRSMATMMKSGIAMGDAVALLQGNAKSEWFKYYLDAIKRKFVQGEGIRLAALNQPIFIRDTRISIVLFDRLSDQDSAMERLGVQAVESAERSAKKIGTGLNFFALMLIGALLGGVIPAIMSVVSDFSSQSSTMRR